MLSKVLTNEIKLHIFSFPLRTTCNSENICTVFCQLQIGVCHGHLPSISMKIKLFAATPIEFQHPLKGVQCGEQKWGTLCSGGKKLAG